MEPVVNDIPGGVPFDDSLDDSSDVPLVAADVAQPPEGHEDDSGGGELGTIEDDDSGGDVVVSGADVVVADVGLQFCGGGVELPESGIKY